MRTTVTALVAAATLAGAAVASSSPAQARHGGWGWGWGLGGFALGAAVGSALAAPSYYPYGYYGYYGTVSLSAALCVAPCMERLRLGSRLRLTDRSHKPSRGSS